MSFRAYFFALTADERFAYAERAASSVAYLTQVAYGNKKMELGMADVLVSLSDGKVALSDLPLTDRAVQQHRIRSGPAIPQATDTPAPEAAAQA